MLAVDHTGVASDALHRAHDRLCRRQQSEQLGRLFFGVLPKRERQLGQFLVRSAGPRHDMAKRRQRQENRNRIGDEAHMLNAVERFALRGQREDIAAHFSRAARNVYNAGNRLAHLPNSLCKAQRYCGTIGRMRRVICVARHTELLKARSLATRLHSGDE